MKSLAGRNLLLAFAFFAVVGLGGAMAQSFAPAQQKNTPPAANEMKTVKGCLTGLDGRYTLGTDSDDLYLLKGDDELFRRYNTKRVRVTGTLTPSEKDKSKADALDYQPPTLTVTKITKLQDNCN